MNSLMIFEDKYIPTCFDEEMREDNQCQVALLLQTYANFYDEHQSQNNDLAIPRETLTFSKDYCWTVSLSKTVFCNIIIFILP
jgi:hypothetical protein